MTAKTAQEFYGDAYARAVDPTKLDEAFKWLNKACEFEGDPTAQTKFQMALNQAIKKEKEGFGSNA